MFKLVMSLIVFIAFTGYTPSTKANSETCHVLDGATSMSFTLSDSEGLDNCIILENFDSGENIKVISAAFRMAHNIKIYDERGTLTDNVMVDRMDSYTSESQATQGNDRIMFEVFRRDSDITKFEVNVSYFVNDSGKYVIMISTNPLEENVHNSPVRPPGDGYCDDGVCYDPLATGSSFQSSSICTPDNTPPSAVEMGLAKEGINDYARSLFNLGQNMNGFIEGLTFLSIHYSAEAQNPKALPGGTEHGGNFRYAVGTAAFFDGMGYSDFFSNYIALAGSAYQDMKQNMKELINYDSLPEEFKVGVLASINQVALKTGIFHIENSQDKESLQEGNNFYHEVYKVDPNRNNVSNSCNPSESSSSESGGMSVNGPFVRPYFFGTTIYVYSGLRGSICDPGDSCYRDKE